MTSRPRTTCTDGQNLYLAVQDQFKIELPYEEFIQLHSIGQLTDAVAGGLPDTSTKCWSRAAFLRLSEAVRQHFGVSCRQIRPSSTLDELIPQRHRRRQWRALAGCLGMKLPRLVRPSSIVWATALAWFVFFIAVWIALGLFMALLGTLVFIPLARLATLPLATRFAEKGMTVRQLVYHLLYHNPQEFTTTGNASPKDIWGVLRPLIADELGVSADQLSLESRFVEDLGVDY